LLKHFNESIKLKVIDVFFTNKTIPTLNSYDKRLMMNYFDDNIDNLQTLLNKDLASWKKI